MNDTVSMKTPTKHPHFSHRYRVIVLFVDNIDNIGDNTPPYLGKMIWYERLKVVYLQQTNLPKQIFLLKAVSLERVVVPS